MAISEGDVRHVAMLSRLELSDAEVARYSEELSKIFEHIEALRRLDTDAVPPTSHALRMSNVLREDAVRPSLTTDEALRNAPESEANCFKVPQVL